MNQHRRYTCVTLVATKTGLMRRGKGNGSSLCPRDQRLTAAIPAIFALPITIDLMTSSNNGPAARFSSRLLVWCVIPQVRRAQDRQ